MLTPYMQVDRMCPNDGQNHNVLDDLIQPLYNGRSYDGWIAGLEPMEFYLHYDGPLPGKPDNTVRLKNDIRRKIHPQMRELWRKEHILRSISSSVRAYGEQSQTGLQFHAGRFARGAFKFAPLVCGDFGLICELEVMFFRREDNRALLTKPKDEYGGDLDNRLKIFLDSLRIPDSNQMEGLIADGADEPVFCLLEDDSLIVKIQLASAYLLDPPNSSGDNTHVRLLTKVTTKLARLGTTSLGYETRLFV